MTDKTLDCSDLDRHMGKPIDPARLKEPLANNDIRRWVQAMHYPNRVHYEDEFADAEPLRAHRGAAILRRRHRRRPRHRAGLRGPHSQFAPDLRRRRVVVPRPAHLRRRPDPQRARAARLRGQGNQVRGSDLLPARRQPLLQRAGRPDRHAALHQHPLSRGSRARNGLAGRHRGSRVDATSSC